MKAVKPILFLYFLFLFHSTVAQNSTYNWVNILQGDKAIEGKKVRTNADGSIYTIGFFEGDLSYYKDRQWKTIQATGVQNLYIQKLDGNGNLLWIKTINPGGKNLYLEGYSIAQNSKNEIYVSGHFQDSLVVNTIHGVKRSVARGYDLFILKLSEHGEFLDLQTFENYGDEFAGAIAIDQFDNLYSVGSYFGIKLDFKNNVEIRHNNPDNEDDLFLVKFDPNGKTLWAESIGGRKFDYSESIFVSKNQEIYFTGGFSGTVDFDPLFGVAEIVSNGQSDVFISKFNSAGKFQWVRAFGSQKIDRGFSVFSAERNFIYLTGVFQDSIQLENEPGQPKLKSNGREDVFIQKLDADGNTIWIKSFGGERNDQVGEITSDLYGNIYLTGSFSNTVDFDLSEKEYFRTASPGGQDLYILKLNSDGDLNWVHGFNSDKRNTQGMSIAIDHAYNIFVTGRYAGTVDFDPSKAKVLKVAKEEHNGFLLKLGSNFVGQSKIIYEPRINIYPNPTQENLTIKLDKTYESIVLKILNSQGQTISDQHLSDLNQIKTNINGPQGIYFIEVTLDNSKRVFKVIK